MKKMQWTVRITFLMILGLVISACTINEAGPIGPEGPQGEPGNANVETVYFSFSYGSQNVNGEYSEVGIDMPEITADIVDGGIVLAYHEKEPGLFQALPYTESYTSGYHYGFNFAYQYNEAVFIFESDDENWTPPVAEVFSGKLVIISGPYGFSKLAGVNLKNYDDVKAALELTE